MLKLVYHTAVFGPIHLEYDRPVIRVGRSEDNDLVLRHPSVEPYHCLLVFRGEKVLCVPPNDALPAEANLQSLAGPEFGVGDQIMIGALRFSLAHSAQSVAIPEIARQQSEMAFAASEAAPGASPGADQSAYFCPNCRVWLRETDVKRMGMVGRPKRCLCPKCSRVLDVEPASRKPPPEPKRGLLHAARKPLASRSAKP